jgi:hypothetical protein
MKAIHRVTSTFGFEATDCENLVFCSSCSPGRRYTSWRIAIFSLEVVVDGALPVTDPKAEQNDRRDGDDDDEYGEHCLRL